MLLGGTARLDLTVITALTGKNVGHQTYEVELELLDRRYLPQFSSTIETILRLIQDTTIIYTTQQRGDLFSYINGLLGKRPDRELLNPEIVVQARNLNMKDLVWGGIVGNPTTSYAVAHKADGIRRLLAFTPQGIWLILPPFYATFVDSTVIPTITGTVLEGELIAKGVNRQPGAPNSKYWFLTYDCLSAGGDRSIQNQSLIDRRVVCQGIADKFKDDRLLSIWTKTLEVLDLNRQGMPIPDRVAQFFKVMNTMFAQENNLAYAQDGLIFTPIFSPYNPGSDQKPLHERILTRYPDICKWKPREKMTIDFSIEWYSDQAGIGKGEEEKKDKIRLYSGERVKGAPLRLVPFEGSFFNTFSGEVDHQNPVTRPLSDGTIVEYRFDLDRQMMVPVRPRTDKTYPNKIDVAISNWDWVHDPVKKETLLGETFDLVFKYHNRIKNGLFKSATQNYRDPTLLDIGSGRGGDVAKWRNFSRIVAVEPNQDYLPELQRRIELNGMKDKVLVLNTGGEDSAAISAAVNEFLGGPADVGALMLSMSFFWRSPEMLDALAQTLLQGVKEDGEIIFLTIDGELVSEMFDPAFRGLKLNKLELGPATLEYVDQTAEGGNIELHIDIPGTIVEKQTEWLVRLYDLTLRMPNFEIKHLHRADTEKFLSSKEDVYTQMYSFGQISRTQPEREATNAPALPAIKINPRETRKGGGNIPIPKKVEEGLPEAVDPAPPIAKLPEREKDRPIQTALPTIPKLARVPREEERTERNEERKDIRQALAQHPIRVTIPVRPARPPRRRQLGWLTVRAPPKPDEPGIGDDVVQSLNVPWYQNVVRIADIGDGSCFMHALLKSFYQPYQDNNSYGFRTGLVDKLRRDIAYALQLPAVFPDGEPIPVDEETIRQRRELGYLRGVIAEDFPYKINYETASDGAFPNIFLVQLAGEFLTDPHGRPIDFSLPGLQQLFNSHRDLGDEVYGYIADLFDLDVFVTYAYPENLETHIDTLPNEFERNRPAIVIAGNGIHYEVVGIDTPDGYQTVYMPDDPFIAALVEQKQRTGRARAAALIDTELAEAEMMEKLEQ